MAYIPLVSMTITEYCNVCCSRFCKWTLNHYEWWWWLLLLLLLLWWWYCTWSDICMLLPELYALPHPNFFKFHVPTSSLARALFVYLLPLSGTHFITAFVSVNLYQLSGNTLKHFISSRHSLVPPAPQIQVWFLALYKFIYLLTFRPDWTLVECTGTCTWTRHLAT